MSDGRPPQPGGTQGGAAGVCDEWGAGHMVWATVYGVAVRHSSY